jgi:hypothetical protein
LRFRGKYAKFQNEEEAVDPDELGNIPAASEGMSIQSSMNTLGEDISQFQL